MTTFGQRLALELDDDACVFVRFIADGGDVGDHFRIHQLRDSLDEHRAIHIVGNLG